MPELTYEATSRSVQTDQGQLHYHEAGDGPPLLLLHGSGPGVSGWANYRGNLAALSRALSGAGAGLSGLRQQPCARGEPGHGGSGRGARLPGRARARCGGDGRQLDGRRGGGRSLPGIRSGSAAWSRSAGSASRCSAPARRRASSCSSSSWRTPPAIGSSSGCESMVYDTGAHHRRVRAAALGAGDAIPLRWRESAACTTSSCWTISV